jgi:hypothetical protein
MLTCIRTGYSQSVAAAMLEKAYRNATKTCWSILLNQGALPEAADAPLPGLKVRRA